MQQLLVHTSGVPDYFDESIMDEYEDLWIDYPNYKIRHNNDLLPLFINKPMMYPKGKKFQAVFEKSNSPATYDFFSEFWLSGYC